LPGARVLSTMAYGALAALIITRWAPLWALCTAGALTGVAQSLFLPASSKVVPELVTPKQLQSATGTMRMSGNTARIIGMSVAGLTVHFVGAGPALAIDAGSFLVEAAMIVAVRLSGRAARRPSRNVIAELREGWREFSSRQWLWVVVVQYSFVIAATTAVAGILGPMASTAYLGGSFPWGLAIAAMAAGRVAGAGLSLRFRPRRPIAAATLATLPAAAPMLVLALHGALWLLVVVNLGAGVAGDIFGVLWSTTMQREIPAASLARVSSYDLLGSIAMAPIGLLIAGPIAVEVGPFWTLAGCAVLTIAATSLAFLSPEVRNLKAPAS
jgi:predicted MFS family arabinose efflux permease